MSAIPVGTTDRKTMNLNGTPREFRPLMLGLVLRRNGIPHVEFVRSVRQRSGKPLSRTALSFLINYEEWPTFTRPDLLRSEIEGALRRHGVAEADIGEIWKPDEEALLARNHKHARPPKPVHGAAAATPLPPDLLPEREMLSPAARKHFQLFRDPFIEEIRGPEDIYLASDQHYIRESMYQTAKNGGFIAVIGESGAGKTVLRHDLKDRVARDGQPIVFIEPRVIDKSKMTARSVCEAILDDLAPGSKPPSSLERLARRVETQLVESYKAGNRHVVVIEEAQDLAPYALKHLKRFYELQLGHAKLLSIILVGQPELRHLLDERHHPELREVIRRCQIAELTPLDKNLQEYLKLKFERAGKTLEEVFVRDAYDAIIARLTRDDRRGKVSMVYPLVVNNVVARAMNLASNMGEAKVSADVIREV